MAGRPDKVTVGIHQIHFRARSLNDVDDQRQDLGPDLLQIQLPTSGGADQIESFELARPFLQGARLQGDLIF
jgi:hypothetical protein